MPRSPRMAMWIAVLVVTTLAFALPAGAGQRGASKKPAQTARVGTPLIEDQSAYELWADDARFAQLSGAAQAQLQRVFGLKTSRTGAPPTAGERPEPVNIAESTAFTNVLVNNPAGDTQNDTQSETSVIVSGNTVVCGFNDSGSNATPGGHFTGWSVSTDGGTSFTDKGVLPTSTGGDAGDPVLAIDNVTGAIYLATLAFNTNDNLQFWKSIDGGQTFTGPINCTPDARAGDSMDKEWITVDNFPGTGQGNIYCFWRNFGGGVNNGGMRFTRSVDGGATFGPIRPWVAIESQAGQGAWVAVGPDHAVYCFWLSGTVIKMRKSTDLGVSFAPAVTVTTIVSPGVNGDLGLGGGFRTNTFPQIVVNPVNAQQVFMAYCDKGAGADKGNIFLTISNDGGSTWSAPSAVNDDATTNDQWQPSLAINPAGTRLFVGYYSRELDVGNSMIDTYCRIGTISGGSVAFDPRQRVSDTSFPVVHGVDPLIVSSYMGDYDHASADATNFYYTWGDNRDDNFNNARKNQNVRFAKIPAAAAPLSIRDTVGAWNDASATFFLRNTNNAGVADVTASLGATGLKPLRGDWDGNGTDTIGVYDSTSGFFFLRNSNTSGPADLTFSFGAGGSVIPVTGDWDGNGTDTIGIYDPATGFFFIRNSNTSGVADAVFSFGPGGAFVPISGDWDGNGTDTIGAYDPATGAFFLRNSNASGPADVAFTFGVPGLVPLAGDWNADGTDTVGVYVSAAGTYLLRNTNTPGVADISVNFGAPGLTPLMGNWDGL